MSTWFKSRCAMVLAGLAALPSAALAQDAYRDASFPPRAHPVFGVPIPGADADVQDGYRQAHFPPEPGRYGGGFIELMMTGASGGAVPPTAPTSAPRAVRAAGGRALPRGSLPDYAPQSPTYIGVPAAQATGYAPEAYASQGYPPQGYTPQAYTSNPNADPLARDPGLATRSIDPMYQRQEVAYSGRERPGTIVIDTPNKFLFLVEGGGRALRYGIGVGRPGFSWAGVKTVSRKAEWPDWTPPSEMLRRRPDLPRHMVGGLANPLGARALYLGSSLYRIHGTNEPYTIGTNVSSGCIRMLNSDVVDLYDRVGVGTRVIVM